MKVVIIDDNEMNIALLKNLVTKAVHCEPVSFTHSPDALRWCEQEMPDLVLVDYMMPELNGLQFIDKFRHLDGKKDIPIVMITATGEKEIRYKALELGANDFLNKPIDNAEFIARARNMLALRESQKALANRAEWLAEEVRKATAEIVSREREVIFRLTKAAEYRSPETGSHILRMALYSKAIARTLGMNEEEQDLILTSAPMHDIGKVGTPDYVLLKTEALTDYEYEIMKEHTVMGYEILQGSKSPLLQKAAEIALAHHEKYDGSGYPKGLKGEEIPLSAQICSICDVFDALTSPRSYKRAWTADEALAEIEKRSGTHFDPGLVRIFKKTLPDILSIKDRYSDNLHPREDEN